MFFDDGGRSGDLLPDRPHRRCYCREERQGLAHLRIAGRWLAFRWLMRESN
jgi:hypothetical protein